MGRTAHAAVRLVVDHRRMDERGILHRNEDDLTETWVAEFASAGVDSIESYLAKHLAFLAVLDES